MKDASSVPFGLIVAYLLPGFIGLAGLAPFIRTVSEWIRPVNQGDASFGPTVYAVLAAMTVGMIVSCVRWLVLDHLLHWTGVSHPVWDDRQLDKNLAGFNYIVEAHYRYYQFYGNTLVAIVAAYGLNRMVGTWRFLGTGTDIGILLLCVVLFAGSRDALRKYYSRTGRLIGVIAKKGSAGDAMTNGNHHSQEAGATGSPPSETKPKGNTTIRPVPNHDVVKSQKPQK